MQHPDTVYAVLVPGKYEQKWCDLTLEDLGNNEALHFNLRMFGPRKALVAVLGCLLIWVMEVEDFRFVPFESLEPIHRQYFDQQERTFAVLFAYAPSLSTLSKDVKLSIRPARSVAVGFGRSRGRFR